MFGICIESSHNRGMGHFFRCINLMKFLDKINEKYIIFINKDSISNKYLDNNFIKYRIVDLDDFQSDWESKLIIEYKINIWINDRLDTDIEHAKNVVKNKIKLITFDDRGTGAELSDLNISALVFNNQDNLKGKKVLWGIKYLILNKEIERFKRIRKDLRKIIVTLGGSDTHGVTIDILKFLKRMDLGATIITGPSFEHYEELNNLVENKYRIKKNVPSLINEFYEYDLAITGGGITPFEATASGLPCILVANELHEIEVCSYLQSIGVGIFAGYYKEIDFDDFSNIVYKCEIEILSKQGINKVSTNGLENIYNEIIKL
ncbi:hypothetical protein [Clostridium saccharoperbutylacetonicum]|uniref:hypothetical protein n=1 Tax=Clostridium saccharoperbutylacetonicum TaxID=36745 RepID=UPI000983DFD2|nr:hypothetical protein [Clostridium saccharoperbutylacetonicum]AQR96982.1 hypothetical protein CLSAP_43060 [Clostridium saccharoperbutylacetonicum]NSB32861.1 spore coat polysaccharide biosynthesis predicted glycosyltransferase SpsG [Clostridium saccharoperbutylacetonicum]